MFVYNVIEICTQYMGKSKYTICVSPEETVPLVDTVPEIFTANAFSIVETTANTSSVFFARTKPCPLANSEATT